MRTSRSCAARVACRLALSWRAARRLVSSQRAKRRPTSTVRCKAKIGREFQYSTLRSGSQYSSCSRGGGVPHMAMLTPHQPCSPRLPPIEHAQQCRATGALAMPQQWGEARPGGHAAACLYIYHCSDDVVANGLGCARIASQGNTQDPDGRPCCTPPSRPNTACTS